MKSYSDYILIELELYCLDVHLVSIVLLLLAEAQGVEGGVGELQLFVVVDGVDLE